MAKTEVNKPAKKKSTTTGSRGFYVSVKVKLDAAEKARYETLKEDLTKKAGYTLIDKQVAEYIIRERLKG